MYPHFWDSYHRNSATFLCVFDISILNIFLSSVFLTHNLRVNHNSIFISLLILLITTFSIAFYLVIHTTSPFWLTVAFNNQTAFCCLTGPVLYFYIRSVLTD